MEIGQNIDIKYPITKEEAFSLLFSDKDITEQKNNVFDEFGNYVFVTDFVTNIPNTAIGTASGFTF